MKKKIVSSLVIAAYCLNSLPVFAAPTSLSLGGALENVAIHESFSRGFSTSFARAEQATREDSLILAYENLKEGQRRWGKSGRKKRFPRKIECSKRGYSYDAFYDPSNNVSSAGLTPELSFTQEGDITVVKGIFVSVDLPKKQSDELHKKLYYSSIVHENESDCNFYVKEAGKPEFLYSSPLSANQIWNEFKLEVDQRISDLLKPNRNRLLSLQDMDENSKYAYALLMPKEPNAGQIGLIESEIGRTNLTALQFQEQTMELSENLFVASYSPVKNETIYALLTQNGSCLPLAVKKAYNGLEGIMIEREGFLEDILFKQEAALSFKGSSDCPFGSLHALKTTTTTIPTVGLDYDDPGKWGPPDRSELDFDDDVEENYPKLPV